MSEQTRILLSSDDMDYISRAIDNATDGNDLIKATVVTTWDAILHYVGKSWDSLNDGELVPSAYAIPETQVSQITNRMLTRAAELNINPVSRAGMMMDWVNVGPSAF